MEYRKKKEQIMKKYKYALYAISVANDVDLETAFKMLQSNMSRGGDYAYIKEEEFQPKSTLNAAHSIDGATDEDNQNDNDIMDDKNF